MSAVFSPGYAVGIGVGADLPVTLDDAAGVARLLPDPNRCACASDQVRLLTGEDVHRDAVLSALDWLAAVAVPDSTAHVCFPGHGVETPDDYLMSYGYDLGDLLDTAIPAPLFTDRLRAVRAKRPLVLLDCCHAGGQADAKGLPGVKSPLLSSVATELGQSSGRVLIASSDQHF